MPRNNAASENKSLFITRIVVDELFGRYSYDLRCGEEESHSSLLLLYGENGTGKTTILSLIYHLLSKEQAKGHRTFLARTQFKTLVVYLGDDVELSAKKLGSELIGSFRMVLRIGARTHRYTYKVDDDGSVPAGREDKEQQEFAKLLPIYKFRVSER